MTFRTPNSTMTPPVGPGPAANAPWWRRNIVQNSVIALVLLVLAFSWYQSGNESTDFHKDESRWLNRAHFITDLFDPFGPNWEDQYLTRGQPPVGSYVMGLGLWLQGKGLDTNLAWDFRQPDSFNQLNGMCAGDSDGTAYEAAVAAGVDVGGSNLCPHTDIMLAGRRTNNALGAIAVVVVFFIVSRLSNRVGGVFASLLLIINPLQTWHNRLALADTTLTLTLALLILCAMHLVRRPSWWWAVAVGVLIGLGGANKFTPMALAGPLGLLGAYFLIRGWLDNRKLRAPGVSWWLGFPRPNHLGWMLVSTPFIALATFVAVNPFLWRDPIGNMRTLIRFRTDEMSNQAVISPQFRVDSPWEAVQRTWTRLGGTWSGTQEFFHQINLDDVGSVLAGLDVWLAAIGFVVLLVIAVRKGMQSAPVVVLLLILTEVATIIASMRTDFERYYLPIVLGFVILAGSAVGTFVQQIYLAARGARRGTPATESFAPKWSFASGAPDAPDHQG